MTYCGTGKGGTAISSCLDLFWGILLFFGMQPSQNGNIDAKNMNISQANKVNEPMMKSGSLNSERFPASVELHFLPSGISV